MAPATSQAFLPAGQSSMEVPVSRALLMAPARGGGGDPAARPRRNQSDSTAAKMGSRCSSPRVAGGGTTTPPLLSSAAPAADEPGVQPRAPRPLPVLTGRSWTPDVPAVGGA